MPEIRLHLAAESLPIWRKTEEELGQMNVPPPYWAFAWAGGQALARFLLDNRDLVAGRRVLDLGAGSGIVSIAAMLAGAAAGDCRRYRCPGPGGDRPQRRGQRRQRGDDGRPICWPAQPEAVDVVLVGDLFYERALAERVLAFVEAAAKGGAEVLVGDPRRSYFPGDRFRQVALYSVPVTRELEDAEIKRSAVWRLA